MMTATRTVLITGATGQVGKFLTQRLRESTGLNIILAARNPQTLADSGLPVRYFDYDDPDSILPALAGVDSVFMMTGYTLAMLEQSKVFTDEAKKSGVRHIVHLGACGDDNTRVAHWAWHQLVERYIEWAGFDFTHLRPESYMQNLLGYQGDNTGAPGILSDYFGDATLSWVACEDVAEVAAACLQAPEKHRNRVYRLGYDAKNYHEIAAVISNVTGKPYRYQALSPVIFREFAEKQQLEPAYMKSIYDHYVAFSEFRIPGAGTTFDNFTAITGKNPMSVTDFILKYQHHFR
ncbi:NmrA family NAD(P)-binding protein [Morganella psychrotolerans]|uniref:NmrA-like domain-containing protein n=1 Tax=Morganella psychrotolerans TaxID=368603 RepID=A0A1B8H0N4_9GAMM|nr:NmrA family NAD(P)-binding protein [Morganella psychrotolerans]OBU02636.1 hypothetical protein AYY18_11525 [Morganella psychrotolerans]